VLDGSERVPLRITTPDAAIVTGIHAHTADRHTATDINRTPSHQRWEITAKRWRNGGVCSRPDAAGGRYMLQVAAGALLGGNGPAVRHQAASCSCDKPCTPICPHPPELGSGATNHHMHRNSRVRRHGTLGIGFGKATIWATGWRA
jgi:hypothetical protein